MDSLDIEKTQVIDLSILHEEPPASKQGGTALDLYAVMPDCLFGDSIAGCVRDKNEDCFTCCSRKDGHLAMAVVADGIGGNAGGEIASAMCVDSMIRSWRIFTHGKDDMTEKEAGRALTDAVLRAGSLIYRASIPVGYRMGTTVAAVLFAGHSVIIANAGDSRVYRLRNRQLEQLSADHTVVAEAVARKKMTPEEAEKSPYRHTITRSLGIHEIAVPQIRVEKHLPGDTYLLCSDGLYEHLQNPDITEIMKSCLEPVQCVNRLLKLTLCRGALDNVTAITIFG